MIDINRRSFLLGSAAAATLAGCSTSKVGARELKPGESQTLTMKVDAYTLASFNEETSAWETAAGNYTAKFGASVADIRATASFKQAKAQKWPVNKVLLPKEPVKEIAVK